MISEKMENSMAKRTGTANASVLRSNPDNIQGPIIREATSKDIEEILTIIESARSFMRQNGNHTQWVNGYPSKSRLLEDIERQNLYVGENKDRELIMVFAFILGEDPTYTHIDGKWLNNAPYGTIHRLASNGKHSGVLSDCVKFCLKFTDNIRIDTHKDNKPMLNALRKCNFKYCGVIICDDGTPREAFQLYHTCVKNSILFTCD